MIRTFGGFLLVLPTAALLLVDPAGAQTYGSPAVTQEQLPPPTVGTQNRIGSQAPPRAYMAPQGDSYSGDAEAGTLPPPGLPASDGQPVAYGHQFGSQPAAIRPPGSIGGASAAAPVQVNAAAAPAASGDAVPGTSVMTLPPEDQPETGAPKELPENLKKQLVEYQTPQPAGTIIVDTPHTYLYLVLGHGKALRYGIGVGREGFTWAGTERVSRMKEWPDWFPPPEMIERQPYLPRMMAGGPGNPLGARALYLGHTLYRIHGTNQPSTIGQTVSSGCIRLLNADIEDLFSRVQVGTRVVVLPAKLPETVASTGAPAAGAVPAQMHGATVTGSVPYAR
jgi:lipoprotein-anchoring transpeptidase ErfK/SrfK